MKALLLLSMPALLLAGCASPAATPSQLMQLPDNEVFEVSHHALVPGAVAYRNIFLKAEQCWQRADRIVAADSFHSNVGFGRISLSTPAQATMPAVVLAAIEVTSDGPSAARITGRSLVGTAPRKADLQNLRLWAEGSMVPCSSAASVPDTR